MESERLGFFPEEGAERDAVHIAIIPAIAASRLEPGQKVAIHLRSPLRVGYGDNVVGVVDPFLDRDVQQEERCWVLLTPNSITSLRHEWTHPSFVVDESDAERALRDFAVRADLGYRELLDAARDYVQHGEHICEGDRWEGFEMYPEFWEHYQIVTGEIVPEDRRGYFFSCIC